MPANSATNSASPMPIGAMKVDRCFSLASIRIVNTSSAVSNASMKRPLGMEVPLLRVVCTLKGAGNTAITSPEAAIPATI